MICDKCGKDVPPNNNAKVYDAALQATSGYQAKEETLWTALCGNLEPAFQEGQIVAGDAMQSILNVLASHSNGRHFLSMDSCEGSPSRRRNVEEGTWGNGSAMDAVTREAAQRAFELMRGMEVG